MLVDTSMTTTRGGRIRFYAWLGEEFGYIRKGERDGLEQIFNDHCKN
jgi:hypothetical protein